MIYQMIHVMRCIPRLSGRVLRVLILAGTGIIACAGQASLAQTSETGGPSPEDRFAVLVSIDGLRWQEVFRGADPALVASDEFTPWQESIRARFVDVADPAIALMPFLHEVVGHKGVLIGNRDENSCARVSNDWWFSYPGYNEMLTGRPDPSINSNSATPNTNVTFLEWLNKQHGYEGRVYAFGSWDVFPAIINEARSGVPVNAGYETLDDTGSERVRLLNRLQDDIPGHWDTVRLDAFTHHFALETLRRSRPTMLYIAYGETDDFAHDGRYDQYLLAAQRTDRFLRELWETLQADPRYSGRTQLIITVDHGRGEDPAETWQHHASPAAIRDYMQALQQYPDGIAGSDQIWMAAIGPDTVQTKMYTKPACAGLDQIAATVLRSLGFDWRAFDAQIGPPLEFINPVLKGQ